MPCCICGEKAYTLVLCGKCFKLYKDELYNKEPWLMMLKNQTQNKHRRDLKEQGILVSIEYMEELYKAKKQGAD